MGPFWNYTPEKVDVNLRKQPHDAFGLIKINKSKTVACGEFDVMYNYGLEHDSAKHRVKITFDASARSKLYYYVPGSPPEVGEGVSKTFWLWYDKNAEVLQRFFEQLLLVSRKHKLNYKSYPRRYKRPDQKAALQERRRKKKVWEDALQNIIVCIQTYSKSIEKQPNA